MNDPTTSPASDRSPRAQPQLDLTPRVVETHTAILFFVGDRVYKLKKAVDLGFLDHTTREARLEACRQEVALNRRLAPDVYLGVLDILDPEGMPCDHLVSMHRMPEDRRLARCVERGEDLDGPLRAIAHAIAVLHAGSPRSARHDQLAEVAAVRRRWVDGFDQLRPLTGRVDRPERLARIEALVLQYLDGRRPLFAARIAGGHIRDGHGDLQAEDIFVLPDGPRVLDCIEFGADYRWGDILSDAAFLAMDLERLGRPDLRDWFLAMHREFSADRWPASLSHHYIAYRAHIRAKITILRHVQHDEPIGPEVGRLLDLTVRHLEQAQVQVVLVGGLPGTGKSTLAAGLGDLLGAVVLRTDEVRLRLGPVSTADRYRPEAVVAVYREMLAEAQRLLELGEHVVLDATWGDEAHRRLARQIAAETSSELTELVCTLSREEAATRIRRRLAAGEDPSEATPAVAAALAAHFAAWPEARTIATEPSPEIVVSQVAAALWPTMDGR